MNKIEQNKKNKNLFSKKVNNNKLNKKELRALKTVLKSYNVDYKNNNDLKLVIEKINQSIENFKAEIEKRNNKILFRNNIKLVIYN